MNAPYGRLTPALVAQMRGIVGGHNLSQDPERLEVYSHDEVSGKQYRYLPEVVVYPESTEQVSQLMALCHSHRIPVTPRGAGTGLSGGAVPLFGGVVLSLEKMNRILELDARTLTVTTQPGVITDEIQKLARENGLLYAGDPCSSDASFIGGNVAENAGGNKVVKYGPTGSHVLGLEVVLADGRVTHFGGKRVKDVTGFDFVHLMVGSEGTLGIITQVTLRLIPLSRYIVDLLVPFESVQAAIDFVPRMMVQARLIPSSIEFMDHGSLQLTQKYLNATLPYGDSGAHLILELEGNDKDVLFEDYRRVGELCLKEGAQQVFVADNRNTREKIWKARKAIAEAISSFYPLNCMEDVVVPIDKIPQLMEAVQALSEKTGISTINFGHAGDGNMHVTFLNTEDDEERWNARIKEVLQELYTHTIALGGTLSGEHGIGLKRKPFLPLVLDATSRELIQRVKAAFDPAGILNPGKIVDLLPDGGK